jgi:uncharacterized membrane protein SirB2
MTFKINDILRIFNMSRRSLRPFFQLIIGLSLIIGIFLARSFSVGQENPDSSHQKAEMNPANPEYQSDTIHDRLSIGISRMRFTGARMRNAYGSAYSLDVKLIGPIGQNNLIFLFGLSIASGTPERNISDWQISSSSVTLIAFDFGLAWTYRPFNSSAWTKISPYIGAGMLVFSGFDVLSAAINRGSGATSEAIDQSTWMWRTTVAIYPIVGVSIPLSETISLEASTMFLASLRGESTELFYGDVKKDYEEKVLTAVRRPDFRFSGLIITLGLAWGK